MMTVLILTLYSEFLFKQFLALAYNQVEVEEIRFSTGSRSKNPFRPPLIYRYLVRVSINPVAMEVVVMVAVVAAVVVVVY